MENKKEIDLICDYCKEQQAIGVYAADHGPFSLAECGECLKHRNLRTINNGIFKWVRFGDAAFNEYKLFNKSEPQIYFRGEYKFLRDVVSNLSEEDIEVLKNNLVPHVKEKFLEKINGNSNSQSQ